MRPIVMCAMFLTGCLHQGGAASDETHTCVTIDLTGIDLGSPVGADWNHGEREVYVHELADGKKHYVGCAAFLPCDNPTLLYGFGFEACVDQSDCLDFGRK